MSTCIQVASDAWGFVFPAALAITETNRLFHRQKSPMTRLRLLHSGIACLIGFDGHGIVFMSLQKSLSKPVHRPQNKQIFFIEFMTFTRRSY
jgi:hypothetical protein